MNLAKYSLDNTKIIYFFLAVLLIGGITSFGKLGKKRMLRSSSSRRLS